MSDEKKDETVQVSVNTDIFHPAENPFGISAHMPTTQPIDMGHAQAGVAEQIQAHITQSQQPSFIPSTPVSTQPASTASGFTLADVQKSQSAGGNAITAGVNKADTPFGGWTSLPGFSGNQQDIMNAANANYAAQKSAFRVTFDNFRSWFGSMWSSVFGGAK